MSAWVMTNEDLLAYILKYVEGCESKRLLAFETVPVVCSLWKNTWATFNVPCRYPTVSPYLSVDEYTTRCEIIRAFPALFKKVTDPFRVVAICGIQNSTDNTTILSLFMLSVVDLAFAVNPMQYGCPCCRGVPFPLWRHVVHLRKWLARKLFHVSNKEFPIQSYIPLLNNRDPVHRICRLKQEK